MHALIRTVLVLSLAAAGLAACDRKPDIPFAPTDTSLRDPDNPTKVFYTDMARVEYDYPLSREQRLALTPENLKSFTQEEIDQIYGRLTAGPIPDGGHEGDLFFARGEDLKSRLDEIIGGIGGRIADTEDIGIGPGFAGALTGSVGPFFLRATIPGGAASPPWNA